MTVSHETRERIGKLPGWAQAEIGKLEAHQALLKALLDLNIVLPEPMDLSRASYDRPVNGYQMNHRTMRVEYSWSIGTAHGVGKQRPEYGGGTQGPGILYAKATDAWKAMRAMLVREMAVKLASIDAKIAEAKNG